ncbi:MAG: helix-turn-helix domain-containing protein [Acidobacteriota bacterium]|nr:helix-turn-helix domain-containing protein [Acidobacteriota bacterium]
MQQNDTLTLPVRSKDKPGEISRREFGGWLQKARESRGLSQKFVAGKAGLSATQLCRIENGRSGTKRNKVILLAKVIGIDEIEALSRFAPETAARLPEELENIPFNQLDERDLKEIADFINFKLFQKRQALRGEAISRGAEKTPQTKRDYSRKAENRKQPEIRPETDLHGVPSYRVEGGRLISDSAAPPAQKENPDFKL